jgi:hypothetical protein
MASSGMLRRVTLVRTDVSEELSASFIRVIRAFLRSVRRLQVTARVFPSSLILVTLMKKALSSSEISVLTRATLRNVPEDNILHSHRRETSNCTFLSIDCWSIGLNVVDWISLAQDRYRWRALVSSVMNLGVP